MQLPVVTMNVNYDDQVEKKSNSISFAMNAEQFAVLFAGNTPPSAFSTLLSSAFRLDLQAARDFLKTYSQSR